MKYANEVLRYPVVPVVLLLTAGRPTVRSAAVRLDGDTLLRCFSGVPYCTQTVPAKIAMSHRRAQTSEALRLSVYTYLSPILNSRLTTFLLDATKYIALDIMFA